MTARKLEAAVDMLNRLLPDAGCRIPVPDVRWFAREQDIGWRTIKEAKRQLGNVQSVKQSGHYGRLCWLWVRK